MTANPGDATEEWLRAFDDVSGNDVCTWGSMSQPLQRWHHVLKGELTDHATREATRWSSYALVHLAFTTPRVHGSVLSLLPPSSCGSAVWPRLRGLIEALELWCRETGQDGGRQNVVGEGLLADLEQVPASVADFAMMCQPERAMMPYPVLRRMDYRVCGKLYARDPCQLVPTFLSTTHDDDDTTIGVVHRDETTYVGEGTKPLSSWVSADEAGGLKVMFLRHQERVRPPMYFA